ncbi:MAG: DUF4199 domain-containing protein [Ferruginibacter sp.]
MTNLSPRNKGIITGALMIISALFCFYVLKQPFESKYQYIGYFLYAAGIIWCLTAHKKNAATTPAFKEFFSTGFKMFVIVTLIMVIFVFVFFYLHPEIRDAKFAENNKLLLQEGNHTPTEIEKNSDAMKRVFLPLMLGITTFYYLFLGSLITAITSAFLSQKK